MSSTGPRIVAVLVTHDGAGMLRRTLSSVAAQTQGDIEIIAVDNASGDGSRDILVELLGPDRVVVVDRDLGFSAAIDLALDVLDAQDLRIGRAGPGPDDLVLLLHDDLELERDAVAHLVAALDSDPNVAIVGPKLRWADDPSRLQSVGATIDLTGRVDDGIDPGELDQGQRDEDRQVLFVPTAGMLLRRSVFDALGRFDVRAHAFREDLDLCWRATIAGYDVEVVPGAVARHAGLAAEHLRGGRVADLGPRYLAERNTLAALITNYGSERLVAVLPLAFLVGVAKVVGFLVTRRIGDARATVAAWGWNLANLRGTLARRRHVQRLRRRRDDEIAPLFARITPRVQAYFEAVLDRITGDAAPGEVGSAETQPSATLQGELLPPMDRWSDDVEVADTAGAPDVAPEGVAPLLRRRVARVLADRPLQLLLPPAVLLLLLGARDLVLPGTLRGGDLVPFPQGASLLTRHLAAWHDSGATLSLLDPSPAQLVLGALQWSFGDGALRILVLVAPVIAGIGAMRALAPYVASTLTRTVLALTYVGSPPLLAAVAAGDVVTLLLAMILPIVVTSAAVIVDAEARVERVWRRLAVMAFLLAAIIAFAPPLVAALPIVLVAGIGHALVAVTDVRWRRTLIIRSIVVATLPLPLLGPWLRSLPTVLAETVTLRDVPLGVHPARWIALDPTGRLLGAAGAGLLLAGLVGALVVSVADVGPTRLRATIAMVALALSLPLLAWWADGAGTTMRTEPLLLIAAATLVGLAALGLQHAPAVLTGYSFGWRQVGAATATVGIVTFALGGFVAHAVDGTPGLQRQEAVPAYLATLGPVPPARILVIGVEADEVVWEIVPATGPDLAAFGVRHDPVLISALTDAVDDLLAGRDPRAATRLGRLGVGVVLVPDGRDDARLAALLRAQTALDPLPSLGGPVARVSGNVPGVAIATEAVPSDSVPDPSVPPRTVVAALAQVAPDGFVGSSGPGGELLAALPFGRDWRVLVDGAARPMLNDGGLIQVAGVPADADVEVVATPSVTRTTLLRGQALWALLVLSLGARPPAFARDNARRRARTVR